MASNPKCIVQGLVKYIRSNGWDAPRLVAGGDTPFNAPSWGMAIDPTDSKVKVGGVDGQANGLDWGATIWDTPLTIGSFYTFRIERENNTTASFFLYDADGNELGSVLNVVSTLNFGGYTGFAGVGGEWNLYNWKLRNL